MPEVKVTGPGINDLHMLAVKLPNFNRKLPSNLRRHLRDAARPVVGQVRASVRAMPAHTQEGLREEIAATVGTETGRTSISVTIVSRARVMPAGKATLPKHTDSARGWKHPVFAHGPRKGWHWVRQVGKPQWFEEPIEWSEPQLRNAVIRAVEETLRELG